MTGERLGDGQRHRLRQGYNFFKIAFTNQTNVPAHQLTFQIDFNASRIVIGDAGGTGPTLCSVIAAHFTDRTSFTAP